MEERKLERKLQMNISDDLHYKLKLYAVTHQTTVTDIVIEALKKYFEDKL